MKYSKNGITVDAIQFTWANISAALKFGGKNIVSEQRDGIGAVGYFLTTSDGKTHLLGNKDWLVKDTNGDFCIWSYSMFEAAYKPLVKL